VCLNCGRPFDARAPACPYCGKPAWGPKRDTHYAVIGGVFCIISGVLGLLTGILIIAISATFIPFFPEVGLLCGVIPLIFGILAMLGGVFAIQRKSFGMAVVGAVFSIPAGYIIFGILALIFIILGKDEFH
jgi:hypothetical protein